MRALQVCLRVVLIGALSSPFLRASPNLPVYLEDSHAGSFYWAARHLPLDGDFTLVLFDAHSDATQLFDSDLARKKLREPQTGDELDALLNGWRKRGLVQCFDWIEPLMPRPFSQVVWVVPEERSLEDAREEVAEQLLAHQVVAPRREVDLESRFHCTRLESLLDRSFDKPVIVSLDLDFFMNEAPDQLDARFDDVWSKLLQIPNLQGITAAISTPYLPSMDRADRLIHLFLDRAVRLGNARIELNPFASTGPDRSRKAKELLLQNKEVPAFDWKKSSRALNSLVRAYRNRIRVTEEPEKWNRLLDSWNSPRLFLPETNPDADGCHRLRCGSGEQIRVSGSGTTPVTWEILTSEAESFNLLGDFSPFATEAPPWVVLTPKELETQRRWIDLQDLGPHLDPETGCGALRIRAITEGEVTNEILLRVSKHLGIRGAIEESFGLPYILGGSLMQENEFSGPDLSLGGDCANLIVYAMRRNFRQLPWMTPHQLQVRSREIKTFTPDDVEKGIVANFGSHAAILIDDLPPKGEINGSDLFAHHLEGRPERITFDALSANRSSPRITVPIEPDPALRLLFGGDTMLARSLGEGEVDPLQHLGEQLSRADLAILNLECALCLPVPPPNKPFVFQAPPESASILSGAGIDLVSLANNHALDGGSEGLRQTLDSLKNAGIEAFGHTGAPSAVMKKKGLRVGFSGIYRNFSSTEFRSVSDSSDFHVAFVHWDNEGKTVSPFQSNLARDLIECGVDLVVGTGTHCIQKTDIVLGKPVFYSLGDLVFDEIPRHREGYLLEVSIDASGKLIGVDQIPYQINQDGIPVQ